MVFLSAFVASAVLTVDSCSLMWPSTLDLKESKSASFAFVASVSFIAFSCCLTSVFTLVLSASSACLSALVVSSVCSFAAIGVVA